MMCCLDIFVRLMRLLDLEAGHGSLGLGVSLLYYI